MASATSVFCFVGGVPFQIRFFFFLVQAASGGALILACARKVPKRTHSRGKGEVSPFPLKNPFFLSAMRRRQFSASDAYLRCKHSLPLTLKWRAHRKAYFIARLFHIGKAPPEFQSPSAAAAAASYACAIDAHHWHRTNGADGKRGKEDS